MEIDELLKVLGMESPSELEYFEQYAELVETETDIPPETLTAFFDEVGKDELIELTDGYFEDTLRYLPDDATELYTVLTAIGQALSGIAAALEAEGNRQLYAEEFCKFRNWFLFDSETLCSNESDGQESVLPVFSALALFRSEHHTDDEYSYDFSGALDYPIDEIMVPLSSLSDDEEGYGDGDGGDGGSGT